jgi:hypothetical protein
VPTSGDEQTDPEAAAHAAGASTSAPEDDDPFPPPLIVALRAPDRPVARVIGPMTPAQARLGVAVTFGISPRGRLLERAAVGDPSGNPARPNVLSLPQPRLSALPTRVATSTAFDGGGADEA